MLSNEEDALLAVQHADCIYMSGAYAKMAAIHTRSRIQKGTCGTIYAEEFPFPPGVLPIRRNIIECMIYLMQCSVADGANLMWYTLVQHWEYCSISIQFTTLMLLSTLKKLYFEFKNKVQ